MSSDSNVTSLSGHPVAAPDEPVGEVVALLQDLLARAVSGEIRALAVAIVKVRGVSCVWTTEGSYIDRNKYALLSAQSLLNFKMNAAFDSSCE